MEEACEIARLPEELVSAALARTCPRDACRAAAVSPAFRAAADSDAVWAGFLPPGGLPPLADGELAAPAPPSSKKELFLRLSAGPALLPDRLVSVWLDRETGTKCYMLSARNLFIVWGDTPQYWTWIPLQDSRFSEGAQLRDVCWLEIRGKMNSKMLSQDTTYAAYMVFKMTKNFYGLDFPVQEASVSSGATNLTRKVCLQGEDEDKDEDDDDDEDDEDKDEDDDDDEDDEDKDEDDDDDEDDEDKDEDDDDDEDDEDKDEDDDDDEDDEEEEEDEVLENRRVVSHGENVTLPQKRADGWMELELGEFSNEGIDDGEVSFSLTETKGGNWKRGLIVQGIEIRRKKSG